MKVGGRVCGVVSVCLGLIRGRNGLWGTGTIPSMS